VEVTGTGKHSSVLQYGNNYDRKKFYNTGLVQMWTKEFRPFEVIKLGGYLQNFLQTS
jgi:hypothetical protein